MVTTVGSTTTTIPIKITQVTPVEDYFMINWRFDIRCNYDCCYCDAEWHSNSSPIRTLEELQLTWQNIMASVDTKGRKIKLAFYGGEPTANRNFLPLVEWLYANYGDRLGHVGFSTNGSAPVKIYERLIGYMDWISFSTHSEFWDEDHFFRTVLAVKALTNGTDKRINVSIMDEPWNQDRVAYYKELLTANAIDFKPGVIRWEHAIRLDPKINTKNKLYKFNDNQTR